MLEKAIKFAKIKHENQKDDAGNDYFLSHLMQVLSLVTLVKPDDVNLQCAALLHDTIEDTETTYEEILEEFGEDIANLVHEVTHEGKKDYKGFYFPRLHTTRGIILKFCDRLSNLSRMETWDEKRKNQYLKKSIFWNTN